MKALKLLYLLILLPNFLKAQNLPTDLKKENWFSISANIESNQFTNSINTTSFGFPTYFESFGDFGFTLFPHVDIFLTKNLTFRTGAYLGMRRLFLQTYFFQTENGPKIVMAEETLSFGVIELPATFSVRKRFQKSDIFMNFGGSLSLRTFSKVNFTEIDGFNRGNIKDGMGDYYISALVSIGYSYYHTDSFKIFVEPHFRYRVNTLETDFLAFSTYDNKYLTFGVAIGASFKLGKKF